MSGIWIVIAIVCVGLLGMAVVYYLANQSNKQTWGVIQGLAMLGLAAVLVSIMTAIYGWGSKVFVLAVLIVGFAGMGFVYMVANKKTS